MEVSQLGQGNGGSGGSLTVTDGITPVVNVTTLDFTSGATVSSGGAGTANVTIASYWDRDAGNGYLYPHTLTDFVGVGTNAPLGKLSIKSAGTTTGVAFQVDDSGGASRFTIFDNGSVNVKTVSGSSAVINIGSGSGAVQVYSFNGGGSVGMEFGYGGGNSMSVGPATPHGGNGLYMNQSSWLRWANSGLSGAPDIGLYRTSAGILEVNDGLTPGTLATLSTKYVKTQATVVASLTAAATVGAGARSFVTDATAPAFGVAVVGGGAVSVPVYSDGTTWLVG